MTNFDIDIAKRTITKLRNKKEFLYIALGAYDAYTIGGVTLSHFNKHNKGWKKDNTFKMVKATVNKIEALLHHNKFLENKEHELMMASRAKLYLEVLKE